MSEQKYNDLLFDVAKRKEQLLRRVSTLLYKIILATEEGNDVLCDNTAKAIQDATSYMWDENIYQWIDKEV